ncbi:integrase core domain-containing protein [Dactylosporangium sp. NPDC050588]|uniref:integrase core domain-containing protein n=1 Tax=Dactylosporangium sp. NPDC050588 TaxID=3157211 RepID=UPI0033D3AE75
MLLDLPLRPSAPLLLAFLYDALRRRRPTAGLIFHSDRGCQYTSAQHARLAADHGIRLSVGRRGQCWDNAVAESFFATLKTELVHRQAWPARTTARKAVFEYIEGWYNTRRRHSSLGYLSPTTYETQTA